MTGLFRAGAALAVCTLTGLAMAKRRRDRAEALRCWLDALAHIKLLLTQERLAMDELMLSASRALPGGAAAARLSDAAERLSENPGITVLEAYQSACRRYPLPCEERAERDALEGCFRLLGTGGVALREQAADACARRLRRLEQEAWERSRRASGLYGRLGALLGVALGIAVM